MKIINKCIMKGTVYVLGSLGMVKVCELVPGILVIPVIIVSMGCLILDFIDMK